LSKIFDDSKEKQIASQHFMLNFKKVRGYLLCLDFFTCRFRLENKLKMLFSENKRFGQEINADKLHLLFTVNFQLVLGRTKPIPLFWRRKLTLPCQSVFTENEPPNSYLFQNKLLPMSLSKVWNEYECLRLIFTKMLVFMPSEQG
jgi:hypothetical protein